MNAVALPEIKLPDISMPELSLPELSLPDMDRLRLTELRDRITPRPRRWPRLVMGIVIAGIVGSGIVALVRSGTLATAGERIRLSLRRWASAPASGQATSSEPPAWEAVTVHPEHDPVAWSPDEAAPVEALR
ncbi:MAG TPA: hypothetical protein VNH13_00610 [Candidatus Acidoferrales bacterium]|jgi:hypothetical protein|nr:hypothetical protein [Candidatus Acidoferrales bacterium]